MSINSINPVNRNLYFNKKAQKADYCAKGAVIETLEGDSVCFSTKKSVEKNKKSSNVTGYITSGILALGGALALFALRPSKALSKGASKLASKFKNISPPTAALSKSDDLIKSAREIISKNVDLTTLEGKNLSKTVEKAIKKGEFEKLAPERLNAAIKLLDENSIESKNLLNLAETFHTQTVANDYFYTRRAAGEIMETTGFKKGLKRAKGEIFVTENEFAKLSVRPKSANSVCSKARNKVLDLKTDIPQTQAQLKELIGDAQGTRMILKPATDLKEVEKLAKKQLNPADRADFMKFIRNEKIDLPQEKLAEFRQLEKAALELQNTKQTQKFVSDFAKGIESGKIRIRELHNYSSLDGVPYLNQAQVDTIKDSYSTWYKKELKKIQLGKSKYTLGENGAIFDSMGNKFERSLLVETISETPKAVKSNGYTAAQFNLITRDGQFEEFQFRGAQIDDMAEAEHIIYDVKSNKRTVASSDYDPVRKVIHKMKKLDETVMDEYNQYFNDVFKAFRKRELGIDAIMPNIEDYPTLMKYLSADELHTIDADGIVNLHKIIAGKKAQNLVK